MIKINGLLYNIRRILFLLMFFNGFYIFGQTKTSIGIVGHPTIMTNFEGILPGYVKYRNYTPTPSFSANIEHQVNPKLSLGIGYFMSRQRTVVKIYGDYNPPKMFYGRSQITHIEIRDFISISGRYFPFQSKKWSTFGTLNYTPQNPWDSIIIDGSFAHKNLLTDELEIINDQTIMVKHPKNRPLAIQIGIGYQVAKIKRITMDLELLAHWNPPIYNFYFKLETEGNVYQFSNTINSSFIGLRLNVGYQKGDSSKN